MIIKHFSSTQLQNVAAAGMDTGEFIARLVASEADVFVVGGDFYPDLLKSVGALARLSETVPVVYAPGNIDFYSRTPMEELLAEAKTLADKIGNMHVLYNQSVEIGGTRFLGATLWTRISEELADFGPKLSNDFRAINTVSGLWNVERQNIEHDLTADFLESELSLYRDQPSVVVTHNIPHPSVNDPKYANPRYRDQSMNFLFVADMEWLTSSDIAPDFWVAGTNIFTGENTLGRTTVVSNGLGHPSLKEGKVVHENPLFDFDRTFRVTPKPKAGLSFKPQ